MLALRRDGLPVRRSLGARTSGPRLLPGTGAAAQAEYGNPLLLRATPLRPAARQATFPAPCFEQLRIELAALRAIPGLDAYDAIRAVSVVSGVAYVPIALAISRACFRDDARRAALTDRESEPCPC